MRCGRCKELRVDVAHVRACYRTPAVATPHARAETVTQPVVHPADDGAARLDGADAPAGEYLTFASSATPAIGPVEFAEWFSGQYETHYSIPMDSDGMTPRLRRLEAEYGFDGMLYMWREETPG